MELASPEFGVVIPQLDWPTSLRFARLAEDAGFDSIWGIDHLVGFPPSEGLIEPWTFLTALAASTERVTVGAQVLCMSFRTPTLLAKMASSLDVMSGGRFRFLIGAGWHEPEYRAFGFDFDRPGQRVAQLEETIAICRAMFDSDGQPVTFSGEHYRADELVNLPAPTRRIPIGIGAIGDRMLDMVARVGDEWNSPGPLLGLYDARQAVLDERLAAHGREAGDVRRSLQIVYAPSGHEVAPGLEMFQPDLGIKGSVDEMVHRVGQLRDKGVDGFYGYVSDEASLAAVGEALPQLRA